MAEAVARLGRSSRRARSSAAGRGPWKYKARRPRAKPAQRDSNGAVNGPCQVPPHRIIGKFVKDSATKRLCHRLARVQPPIDAHVSVGIAVAPETCDATTQLLAANLRLGC